MSPRCTLLCAAPMERLRKEGCALVYRCASPVVAALQALRGVQLIAAITLVAEIQDFWRSPTPRGSCG